MNTRLLTIGDSAEALTNLLSGHEDCEIVNAQSCEQAAEFCEEDEFDLIVSDREFDTEQDVMLCSEDECELENTARKVEILLDVKEHQKQIREYRK